MASRITNKTDKTILAVLTNRMMWQDPIAAYRMQQLVENATTLSRGALMGNNQDPRRNIYDECGYPTTITPQDYRDMYDREPIASRVVQVQPLECWAKTPEVYEDEDVENVTPFEQAWHDLAKNLRGESYYQDEEGNPIWEILLRGDIVSGIGTFGLVMLGLDDGGRLDEPVEGFEDSPQSGGSFYPAYGTDAQYGAITLMPRKKKPIDQEGGAEVAGATKNQEAPDKKWTVYTVSKKQLEFTTNSMRNALDMFYRKYPNEAPIHITVNALDVTVNDHPFAEETESDNDRPNFFKRRNGQGPLRKGQNYLNEIPEEELRRAPPDSGRQLVPGMSPGGQIGESLDPVDEGTRIDPTDSGNEGDPNFISGDNQSPIDPNDPNYQGDAPMTAGDAGADTDEPNVAEGVKPVKTERKLTFLRVFDETLIWVVQYESDPTSIRYGHPVYYNVILNDPRTLHGGIGLTQTIAKVHWSRVLHLADNLVDSEVFGQPRMLPVYNRLMDLQKLHSGSAEMYWKGAFPGFSLETHPQLGGDVAFDTDDIKDQMENYFNGLQRYLAIAGAHMNSMAPQVVDPTTQIEVQIDAICIQKNIPNRVFKGSERGELASSQDDQTWNDRCRQRQNNYITPRIIVPFIDRLIKMKVLPIPNGFSVTWPDLNAMSEIEKAQRATALAGAMAQFVSGQLENIMDLQDFYVRVCGFDEEEAAQIVEKKIMASGVQTDQGDMFTQDPEMDQEFHDATIEQMTNPDLVPDNIQTGDHQHMEAGSMDKQAELEHERLMAEQQQQGQMGGQPMPGGEEQGGGQMPPGMEQQMPQQQVPGVPAQMPGQMPAAGGGKKKKKPARPNRQQMQANNQLKRVKEIVENSFPGHAGRPGKKGGSVPSKHTSYDFGGADGPIHREGYAEDFPEIKGFDRHPTIVDYQDRSDYGKEKYIRADLHKPLHLQPVKEIWCGSTMGHLKANKMPILANTIDEALLPGGTFVMSDGGVQTLGPGLKLKEELLKKGFKVVNKGEDGKEKALEKQHPQRKRVD